MTELLDSYFQRLEMENRSIESRDTTSMKIHWSRLETE